jgi:hypothetical protein
VGSYLFLLFAICTFNSPFAELKPAQRYFTLDGPEEEHFEPQGESIYAYIFRVFLPQFYAFKTRELKPAVSPD